MLGIDYGSDSDSDSEAQKSTTTAPQPTRSTITSKLPPPTKKSTFSLPAPTNTAPSKPSTGGLALPAPKTKKPKKITIGLPALPADDDDDLNEDQPPAKRARTEGAGRSGLLSMLPAPKNKAPILPAKERVLGGGGGPGLVFKTSATVASRKVTIEDEEEEGEGETAVNLPPTGSSILEEVVEKKTTSIPFLPPSLQKGKANISTEDRPNRPLASTSVKVSSAPAIDFFGLGASSSSSSSRSTLPSVSAAPSVPGPSTSSYLPSVSSAPKVEEYTPPEPTPQDPYPGYYMLPSGSWAAYDTDYYKSFYDKWKKEYDKHVRDLEKGVEKGFEGMEEEGTQEVDAFKEMERARVEIQEREEKKALTAGAGNQQAAPKMNIKGAALSGRARGRHQLSSLLTEAYQNRDALEEKIAMGRRNRKEAGNKYGF